MSIVCVKITSLNKMQSQQNYLCSWNVTIFYMGSPTIYDLDIYSDF